MTARQDMSNGNRGAGHDQARCGARCRGSGEPCRLPAGWGTPTPGIGRCRKHFGSTPNHQEHARQVLVQQAEQAALAELATLNVPPMGNPLEQLAQLAAEAKAWTDMLRQRVAELTSLTGPDHLGDERVRPLVCLLERAMDRLGQLCTALARLDVDERLYRLNRRISEAQGQQVFEVISGLCEDLDLSPEQWAVARESAPRRLRAIGARDG